MSRTKPKFYVVWEGHRPGVYANWEDASRQVSGFSGAKYKSFGSRAEAEAAYRQAYEDHAGKAKTAVRSEAPVLPDSIAVDAACSGNPGRMEYRGVDIATGAELFHAGPFEEGTNNVGEFLAIVHALSLLQKQGKPRTAIYSDSVNAQNWVRQKKCRTTLERTGRNDKIFELIARAERWLRENEVTNPILKWETGSWGEIPADFGRK